MARFTGLLACATIALVAVAAVAVPVANAVTGVTVVQTAGRGNQGPGNSDKSDKPATPDTADTPDTSDRGEQIQNRSCSTTCHDLRPVQTQALDKEGWTRIVASMVDKGAEVKADEAPLLVDFLVRSHGPLPDGAGKLILLNTCTLCHGLDRVIRQGGTREEWEDTLGAMLNEGAMLSEEDFPVLLAYLARNFKPQ